MEGLTFAGPTSFKGLLWILHSCKGHILEAVSYIGI